MKRLATLCLLAATLQCLPPVLKGEYEKADWTSTYTPSIAK